MGFCSGVVIGVALMDLLPEALELGRQNWPTPALTGMMVAGFMAYMMIDRAPERLSERSHALTRHIGPASLVFHSLMDGLGIGVAFDVSTTAGLIVAAAVLAHDVVDGANTIALGLAGDVGPLPMRGWLVLDAVAPLIGIGASQTIHASTQALSLLLAVFAGMFLYIGAAKLLALSRARAVGLSGASATVFGAAFTFAVMKISSG